MPVRPVSRRRAPTICSFSEWGPESAARFQPLDPSAASPRGLPAQTVTICSEAHSKTILGTSVITWLLIPPTVYSDGSVPSFLLLDWSKVLLLLSTIYA